MKFAPVIAAATALALAGSLAVAQDVRPKPRPTQMADVVTTSAEVAPDGTGVLSSIFPKPRPDGLMKGQEIRFALSAARAGDWLEASKIARKDGDVAADIIEWQRLRAGKGTFADYLIFLSRNSEWPGLKLLRKKGEATIPENSAPADVITYFATELPQTGYGVLRYAAALADKGEATKSQNELIRAWTSMELSAGAEASLLDQHGATLKPHHATRLDFALWENDSKAARRMLPLVSSGHKAVANARFALRRGASEANALINKIPADLADHPGVKHDRMLWQIKRKNRPVAADVIIASSTSATSLGRPEYWSHWRRVLARQEMRAGNAKRAYQLSSTHHLTDGSDFADLEWLSGYLALRYLDRPADALSHFRRFRTAVYTPISLGRAGYWEGRASEAMGDAVAAKAAFADAAQYQTSFYGLLAAEKIGAPMDPSLTGSDQMVTWRGTAFSQTSVFEAARLFHKAGQTWEVSRFLRHLSETTDKSELIQLGDFALSLGDPYLSVRVGKQIAREGVVAHRAYYPLTELGEGELPVSKALALSIARRESEFHAGAVSGAGARGLMQLMPGTAQQMAGSLNMSYSKSRLTSDPVYNATLGSAYLAYLIEEFGNNIPLVSAGYNAGPHRSRTWIKSNGDPRDPGVDVVDWIEHIPFRETRNYVMRVAESQVIYRARLTGKTKPIALTKELKQR